MNPQPFLSTSGVHLWALGCLWVQAEKYWRRKKKKIITSLVLFQVLISFPNLPATTLKTYSLDSYTMHSAQGFSLHWVEETGWSVLMQSWTEPKLTVFEFVASLSLLRCYRVDLSKRVLCYFIILSRNGNRELSISFPLETSFLQAQFKSLTSFCLQLKFLSSFRSLSFRAEGLLDFGAVKVNYIFSPLMIKKWAPSCKIFLGYLFLIHLGFIHFNFIHIYRFSFFLSIKKNLQITLKGWITHGSFPEEIQANYFSEPWYSQLIE